MTDIDYMMTGVALLIGIVLAAVVTMLSLAKTGRVPSLLLVLSLMLGCAVVVLGVVEGAVPH